MLCANCGPLGLIAIRSAQEVRPTVMSYTAHKIPGGCNHATLTDKTARMKNIAWIRMSLIDDLNILSRQQMITVVLSFHTRRAEMMPGDLNGILPALPRGT
ncbi:Uncharacterized protein HZ326_17804 [Fusarium oxysporum f. sp. albedinis]|nr:Uncharacterized protein HZ326_17804 [Fusarium oxysporum f. sp. albedinis]